MATPATIDSWLASARGKNLRQIEEVVAGHIKGDEPDDPRKPDRLTRRVTMELRLDTIALLGRVRERFSDERGEVPDEDMLIAALCNAYLDGDGSAADDGRAKFQLMTVACPSCDRAAHESAGRRYPIDAADRARVECDVQRVGSDAAPGRATQDVTPKTRRFVRRRDQGKCCVPGCRASRYLELHHIMPREAGGSHDADNLILTCDAHHRAVHQGKLVIAGKAPAIEVRWLHAPNVTHVGRAARAIHEQVAATSASEVVDNERTVSGHGIAANERRTQRIAVGKPRSDEPAVSDGHRSVVGNACSTPEHMKLAADALSVLVTDLRFPKQLARAAIDVAFEELGPTPALERLIFIAVRSCSSFSNK